MPHNTTWVGNWSPKTLNINILLVKRSQKERPRLEMARASRITCALKMSWKLKTAHRTIRCGMPWALPWASQQGSILFLQRKLTKASGFFTPAELIWEALTCGNFHKETWWQSSWFGDSCYVQTHQNLLPPTRNRWPVSGRPFASFVKVRSLCTDAEAHGRTSKEPWVNLVHSLGSKSLVSFHKYPYMG